MKEKETEIYDMNNRLFPIELCRYTLRKSVVDDGNYPEFHTAQELLEESQ